MAAAVLLLTASAVTAVWIGVNAPRRHDPSQDRQYSEKGVDEGSQLRYSPDTLGDYQVAASHLSDDGSYFECLRCGDVTVRLWRSPAEQGLTCKALALRKVPSLAGYRSEALDRELRNVFDQRGRFTESDGEGGSRNHTVLFVSRGGWDYFVDFDVPKSLGTSRDAWVETVISGIYFI